MGEPVNVAVHETSRPGVVRFETDRPLTGMGHRNYRGLDDVRSVEDPADELARRLFERGGVDHVHVYGNLITVELARGVSHDGIQELLQEMFLHYVDRVPD